MKFTSRLLPALLIALMSGRVFALGADQSGPLKFPEWPDGLNELINLPNRAHAYFINEFDFFYFTGDTKALNDFLKKYADIPGLEGKVAFEEGGIEIRSPWDKERKEKVSGWLLSTSPKLPTTQPIIPKLEIILKKEIPSTVVIIYPGNAIDLKQVQVPTTLTVITPDPKSPASRPTD